MWTDFDKEQVKKNGVTILVEDCDRSFAQDKTLPRNSYLVTYEYNGFIHYDIVQANARVKIFDSYYDRIGNGIKSIDWTDGTVNPRIYGEPAKPNKRKR